MKNFLEYYKENAILESYVEDLTKVNPDSILKNMTEIEQGNFPSYYASGEDELRFDFGLGGFIGYGLFDDYNRITGYIYGYNMGEDGELDELEHLDISDVNFYSNDFKSMVINNGVTNVITSNNTIYVSNFVVNKQNRVGVSKLLIRFLREVKQKGYKFMCFDGLPDTLNMFTGGRKSGRLESGGLAILADIDIPQSESKLTILHIK